MYSQAKKYKFQLCSGIVYTGFVQEEDSTNIRIKTQVDEELILSKKDIIQAKVVA